MNFKVKIISENKIEYKTYNKKILLFDILTENRIFFHAPCGGKGMCKKCTVLLNGEKVLACSTYVDSDSTVEISDISVFESVDFTLPENFFFQANKTVAVIDIGTTAVKAYLFFGTKLLEKTTEANVQIFAGSDVISRIASKTELSEILIQQVKKIIDGFSKKPDIVGITGNTAMLYFYNKLDVAPLGVYPFETKELFGKWEKNIFFPKCISAFVGADAVCSLISSGITEEKEKCVLVCDIGTNSEILLWNNGKITAGSAAAGPVFEGAQIEKGCFAKEGAINKVWLESGIVCYETIGQKKASGICGSGLIDAVSVMLDLGVIDESGYIEKNFYITDDVYLTPEDIRNVQLAKAAICSAVEIITKNISPSEIYISGSFGNSINIENAVKIGLFPKEITKNIIMLGNGAAAGTLMTLLDSRYEETAEKICADATVLELSLDEEFNERYIKNLNFTK